MGRGRHPITGRPYKSGTKIPDQTLKEALGIGGDSKNKQAGKKNKEGRHPITGRPYKSGAKRTVKKSGVKRLNQPKRKPRKQTGKKTSKQAKKGKKQ